jgi:DNA mismatch repair protein MutL
MRVLYERYLAKEVPLSVSQTLLVPEEITLSQAEVMALVQVDADLKEMGLDLRQVDTQTVAVHAVPSDLATHLREAIDGILESYHDGQWEGEEDRRVLWAQQWAKRAAMSGQAPMPLEARRNLVQALWACETPSMDPMGRVTQAMWSGSDIQNFFS